MLFVTSNLVAQEKATADGSSHIDWGKLVDIDDVKNRKLNNEVVVKIVKNDSIWGSGYLVSGKNESGLQMVLGANSPFSTSSGTMGVKAFGGVITDGAPDSAFYGVLGIGTSVDLPGIWFKIFGVEFKGLAQG